MRKNCRVEADPGEETAMKATGKNKSQKQWGGQQLPCFHCTFAAGSFGS